MTSSGILPPSKDADAVSATVTSSGNASADNGGIANTGVMGDVMIEHYHYPLAASRSVWPVQVGRPPAMASAFQPRQRLRERALATRHHGDDVVLAQVDGGRGSGGPGTRVLAGGGGVGKSQLAAWIAHDALGHGTDMVVWAAASSPDQVITTYARAAVRVGVPGADGADLAADAEAFLEWLHTTDRTWLVVLDDITDPAHLTRWWPPHRTTGWTLATTRLQDATLASSGRQRVDIDVYTPDESMGYLADRLTNAGLAHLLDARASELAAALGHLPLALSHAAAHMINQEEGCATYLARYTTGRERLAELMPASVDPDDYGRPVAVTLLLALDAADTVTPAGLARPALVLAAVCDPDGHPDALWATAAVTGYLSAHRTAGAGQRVSPEQARKALRLLHRYGLLTHTPTDGVRAVRIHALTARAARETTSDLAPLTHAAADALLQLWPADDHITTDLVAALRTNATTLASLAGDLLWHPEGHPLLYRAGRSLLQAGLYNPAVTYWHDMAEQAARLLGGEHTDTLTARANLAASYWQAGRTTNAITILEELVGDAARLLGHEHPETLTARANLGNSYWQAGRTAEAIIVLERVVADRERLLGDGHPDTLMARANLGNSYWQAGRTAEAIIVLERVVADRERLLGDGHPDTLIARASLATSYWQAGRTAEAATIREKVAADSARLLGDEHPDTLTARNNLATSYQQVGRITDAVAILEQVVADSVRMLGHEHPKTLAARANLATSYWKAGRTTDAVAIDEQVFGDRERLLGDEHPDTLSARANLANSYQQAGRTTEATTALERLVADFARVLGHEHPDTLSARANLANSYQEAGRTTEAIGILERVVADRERILGDEHPDTLVARANLAGSYQKAGRTTQAIAILGQAVADLARVLGPEHPDTTVRAAGVLREWQPKA
ncbi:tetratricopeptide repeat protein [Micromonospora chalcea]